VVGDEETEIRLHELERFSLTDEYTDTSSKKCFLLILDEGIFRRKQWLLILKSPLIAYEFMYDLQIRQWLWDHIWNETVQWKATLDSTKILSVWSTWSLMNGFSLVTLTNWRVYVKCPLLSTVHYNNTQSKHLLWSRKR